MNRALILIDIQNDYFPTGKNQLHQTEQAAFHAKQVLEYFRSNKMPVFHIRHVNLRQGATFFLPNSFGAEIHQSVAPQSGEMIIVKHAPNAFLRTGLADDLIRQDIKNLVICGMMSHMCIDTTVRAAQDFGFSVTLLEDACTTKMLTWHEQLIPAETVHHTIMAALNGIFAQVVGTVQFLADADMF